MISPGPKFSSYINYTNDLINSSEKSKFQNNLHLTKLIYVSYYNYSLNSGANLDINNYSTGLLRFFSSCHIY